MQNSPTVLLHRVFLDQNVLDPAVSVNYTVVQKNANLFILLQFLQTLTSCCVDEKEHFEQLL